MMLNTTNSPRSSAVPLRRKRVTTLGGVSSSSSSSSTRRKKRNHTNKKNRTNGRFYYCGFISIILILFIVLYNYIYKDDTNKNAAYKLEQKVAGKVKNVIYSKEQKLMDAFFDKTKRKTTTTNPIVNSTELIQEAERILEKRIHLRNQKQQNKNNMAEQHPTTKNRIKVHHPRNPNINIDKNKVPSSNNHNNHNNNPNWVEEGSKIKRSSRFNFLSTIPQEKKRTKGFVLLGMHRSGTSMLGGLLVSMGYHVGRPLIGEKPDNPKGFFELLPVVIQNDEFLKAQNCNWAANMIRYKPERGIQDFTDKIVPDNEMKKALSFLNNPTNTPWMQKDPRMCITLPTWLPFLDTQPAVLFTYRHPLYVALSLKRRQNISYEQSLRLWIVYNMRALQNSKDLCMLTSSNSAVLKDPLNEVQRISDHLTTKCNVPAPPHKLNNAIVNKFVDTSLQHAKDSKKDKKVIWMQHKGCDIEEYTSVYPTSTILFKKEKELYMKAMIIFCDLESREAYRSDYEWPNLTYEGHTYE